MCYPIKLIKFYNVKHINGLIWFDKKIIDRNRAVASAESIAIKYGAGCFITLRYYAGRYLHFEKHFQRLVNGMRYLGVDPDQFPDPDTIKQAFHMLTEKADVKGRELKARFQVFISNGGGYSLNSRQNISMAATLDTIKPVVTGYILNPVDICVIPNSVRPSDLKLCNNLHFMKAWRQAEESGANNALMSTFDDRISGTATGNIFWKKNQQIYTPDISCDILNGVTRGIFCKLIREQGDYLLNVGSYQLADILHADAVWMTNSVSEMQPVSQVDQAEFNTNDPVFAYLGDAFSEYKKEFLRS